MTKYEIEVRDTLGSWTANNRRFKPGRYIVDDEAFIVAAKSLPQHISYTELPDDDESETGIIEFYDTELTPDHGLDTISRESIAKGGETVVCPVCFQEFKKVANMRSHFVAKHKPEDIPVVEEPTTGEPFKSVYDDDEEEEAPEGLKVPEIDLPKVEPPQVDMPKIEIHLDPPKVELPWSESSDSSK